MLPWNFGTTPLQMGVRAQRPPPKKNPHDPFSPSQYLPACPGAAATAILPRGLEGEGAGGGGGVGEGGSAANVLCLGNSGPRDAGRFSWLAVSKGKRGGGTKRKVRGCLQECRWAGCWEWGGGGRTMRVKHALFPPSNLLRRQFQSCKAEGCRRVPRGCSQANPKAEPQRAAPADPDSASRTFTTQQGRRRAASASAAGSERPPPLLLFCPPPSFLPSRGVWGRLQKYHRLQWPRTKTHTGKGDDWPTSRGAREGIGGRCDAHRRGWR